MVTFSDKNRPIYLQIADRICDSIHRGEYGRDERIPSVRETAASMEVNANTVMRAYNYLQQRGVLANRRGIGYFVAEDGPARVGDLYNDEFIENDLRHTFDRLAAIGLSEADLSRLYVEYLTSRDMLHLLEANKYTNKASNPDIQ